jgi:phosphate transport system substrate-binding protein
MDFSLKPFKLMGAAMAAITAIGLSSTTVSAQSKIIQIDGSSTVFPITEAVAEEFQKANPDIKVTVGISGTGGGFKKFCKGETHFSGASRPIKESEITLCAGNKPKKVEYVALPVAYDALSVVVHPQNTWATSITVSELKKLWEPAAQGKISRWNQIRPGWPNEKISLYGPGSDSGTFDYFTDKINGEEGASRGDYTASEDDNVLVQGVTGDKFALGYFGYAYFQENAGRLKAVAIDAEKGKGAVSPSPSAIESNTYQPLGRPIFVYVSKDALSKPEVRSFAEFLLQNAPKLVGEVGYVPLKQKGYDLGMANLRKKVTGEAAAQKIIDELVKLASN